MAYINIILSQVFIVPVILPQLLLYLLEDSQAA